jgi:outer membrane protein assembly factor BamB
MRALTVLSAAAGLGLGLAVLPAAAQTLLLSPAAGPPTRSVAVTGTGWGALSVVDIYFDLDAKCLALASGAGAIGCTLKVPETAQPGQHWVSAIKRAATPVGVQKAFTVRTDWTQWRGRTGTHDGFNRFENTIDAGNAPRLDVLWRAPLGSSSASTPIVTGGRVFVGAADGKLHSFNAKTGVPYAGWPRTTGGTGNTSSPVYSSAIVYIGANDGKVYAFNWTSGAAIAGFPVTTAAGAIIFGAPLVAYGKVYAGAGNGKLYAFNATTGAAVFNVDAKHTSWLSAQIHTTPMATLDKIYVMSSGGVFCGLFAFDATSGGTVAGFPHIPNELGNNCFGISSPSVLGLRIGMTYFTTVNIGAGFYNVSKFRQVRATDGQLQTVFQHANPTDIGSYLVSSPAMADGIAYFSGGTDGGNRTTAVSLHSGGLIWENANYAFTSSPVVANGLVYGSLGFTFVTLDATSGNLISSTPIESGYPASPVISDGVVYIASTDGYLYALSVDGEAPAAAAERMRAPGHPLSEPPATSALIPNLALAPSPAPAQ